MKVLVTGSVGFIGAAVTQCLLARGDSVVGVDNHNDYYDPKLKNARLALFADSPNYIHLQADIADRASVEQAFNTHQPDAVIHLAAQAGVRYSLDNPRAYIESNIVGFMNVLEGCRHQAVKHLVYASSSSVYGANTEMPFSTHQNVDHPLSLYAASKKSNELMAHTYSHLFNLPCTGLRFFTVYGPWSRPDMALFKFAKAILSGDPIHVYNYGKHRRDFTYIDDVVEAVVKVLDHPAQGDKDWNSYAPDPASSAAPWRLYNVGSNRPVELLSYIAALEVALNKPALKELLPLQPGDVPDTFANISELVTDFDCAPSTPIEIGVDRFAKWYRAYYNV
jgi:UDP-glucuronate 4-epimerase